MWLKSKYFATTQSLQTKLAASSLTEVEQEWCCYIQNKVLSHMRDRSLVSVHHDYYKDKIGRGYVRWIKLLEEWEELEVIQNYTIPYGFTKGKTKQFWVPNAAVESGIVIRDFKAKRIKRTTDKSKFPSTKPWVQFIFKNLKMLSARKDIVTIKDPVIRADCHLAAKKIFHGELNVKTGSKVNRLSHTVIQMPKEGRANLVWRDTNKPLTCEHDIKSCHPVLLLTLATDEKERTKYKKWLDRDIYDAVRVTKNLRMSRQQVKDLWCLFVNWEKKSQENCKNNAAYQFYHEHFPILTTAILRFPKLAVHLQNLESSIMVDAVGNHCMGNNYWYVPMHDGFLCENKNFYEISNYIGNCFLKLVGHKVIITTKSFSYINITLPPLLHHMRGYKAPNNSAWQQQVYDWKTNNPEQELEAEYDQKLQQKRKGKFMMDLKRQDEIKWEGMWDKYKALMNKENG